MKYLFSKNPTQTGVTKKRHQLIQSFQKSSSVYIQSLTGFVTDCFVFWRIRDNVNHCWYEPGRRWCEPLDILLLLLAICTFIYMTSTWYCLTVLLLTIMTSRHVVRELLVVTQWQIYNYSVSDSIVIIRWISYKSDLSVFKLMLLKMFYISY